MAEAEQSSTLPYGRPKDCEGWCRFAKKTAAVSALGVCSAVVGVATFPAEAVPGPGTALNIGAAAAAGGACYEATDGLGDYLYSIGKD